MKYIKELVSLCKRDIGIEKVYSKNKFLLRGIPMEVEYTKSKESLNVKFGDTSILLLIVEEGEDASKDFIILKALWCRYMSKIYHSEFLPDYKPRAYLFLDIDGVLNRFTTEEKLGTTERWRGMVGMEPYKVGILNHIVEELDLNIVISSSWGYRDNTLLALEHFGFKHCNRILGGTVKGINGRGNQIIHYMEDEHIPEFYIIDDECWDIDGGHESVSNENREFFNGKVIATNIYEGITEEIAEDFIKMAKGRMTYPKFEK